MKIKLLFSLAALCLMFGVWNCQDLPPTAGVGPVTPGIAHIAGVAYDINTQALLQNAKVYFALTSKTDSAITGSDGVFRFEVDLSNGEAQSALLTLRKLGYVTRSMNLIVSKDTALYVGLQVDLSTSAQITGVLRDSSTLYPLRGGTILLTIPGVVDSVSTPNDGSFSLTADLIDRDSLPVTLTAIKTGYKTRQVIVVLHKGQATNLGNILMKIDVQSTAGQVLGRIFDRQSLLPIAGSMVHIASSIRTDSVLTASDGSYSFTIDLSGLSSVSGLIKAEKSGYRPTSINFSVGAGQTFTQDLFIDRDTTTGIRDSSATGSAHSIAFIGMTVSEISVYGVGGTESTILTWEVRDSLGYAIDFDHRDTVEFALIGVPVGGGAYVSPSRAITNGSGRVATTVNSGTVSGVVQFVATLRRNSDGSIIQSTPVIITVNAGLPDQTHFTIGAASYNFAAWDWLGRTDDITVLVGDKYSNPVKINTAVYFNTTGGVIDASGFTDHRGFTINPALNRDIFLYSGNPQPTDPVYGVGYAWVRAWTLGQGGVTVADSILTCFSGHAFIEASTYTVHIDSSAPEPCVSIPIKIHDENGNPLAAGTQVAIQTTFSPPALTNWSVNATGLPTDPFDDHIFRGPGTTDFTLTICDGTPGRTPAAMPFTVKVSVTGPNGNYTIYINGDVGRRQ
jgi:hypothetical protein